MKGKRIVAMLTAAVLLSVNIGALAEDRLAWLNQYLVNGSSSDSSSSSSDGWYEWDNSGSSYNSSDWYEWNNSNTTGNWYESDSYYNSSDGWYEWDNSYTPSYDYEYEWDNSSGSLNDWYEWDDSTSGNSYDYWYDWNSGYIVDNSLQPVSATLNQRMATRSGPSTDYTDEFGTLPQSTPITLYQMEYGGSSNTAWGMVEVTIDGQKVRLYTGMKRINYNANDNQLDIATGEYDEAWVTREVRATYGPGYDYRSQDYTLPAWYDVRIYHEENGFVLADYVVPGSTERARGWIPVEYIGGYESDGVQAVG